MVPQPAEKGVKIPLGSASSKLVRVKRPERTSGGAKKITTSGRSAGSSLSYLLKMMNWAGALNMGNFLNASLTNSGVFL